MNTQTNNNTQTVQYALASTVNDGLLCRKEDGTVVVSTEYEDGEIYEGSVKLFDTIEAANAYIESTESWALTPLEFTENTENTQTVGVLTTQNLYTFVREYTPKNNETNLYHTLRDANRQIEQYGGMTSDMVRSIKTCMGMHNFA